MRIEIRADAVVVGCATCGTSMRGEPSEIEVLVAMMPMHLGPLVLAERITIDGLPLGWHGDPALVARVSS